jgi:hypothetical protein
MTCDLSRNALLTTANPGRPPAAVAAHLAGCEGCAGYAERLIDLDRVLAALPVPPPDPAALANFLDKLADGPIITRVPTVPRRDTAVARMLEFGRWRYPAGLAAGVAVAVGGGWWLDRPPAPPAAEVVVRSELLGKQVRHVTALSRTNDPRAKLTELVGVADALRGEARQMYLIAAPDEMAGLQALFDKAVLNGVVRQAERLPAGDRAGLAAARSALAAAEGEAAALAGRAPAHTRPMLDGMAATARTARERLDSLIRDGGA